MRSAYVNPTHPLSVQYVIGQTHIFSKFFRGFLAGIKKTDYGNYLFDSLQTGCGGYWDTVLIVKVPSNGIGETPDMVSEVQNLGYQTLNEFLTCNAIHHPPQSSRWTGTSSLTPLCIVEDARQISVTKALERYSGKYSLPWLPEYKSPA
jgi:hypothetical protein